MATTYTYGAPVGLRRPEDDEVIGSLVQHGRSNIESGGAFRDERGYHSVLSTSVEDERLNEGRPTLIPSVYEGRQLEGDELIERAISSGTQWPSFDTNELATEASKRASSAMDRHMPRRSYGENVPLRQDRDLEPPPRTGGFMGWIFNAPTDEEATALREYHSEEATEQRSRQMTSTAPGGGYLGLPHPDDLIPPTLQNMRRRTQEMVDATWEGFEEDPVFTTLRKVAENSPDRFLLQYAGAMRGGKAVSPYEMEANARYDGVGEITESSRNQEIAELFVQRGIIEPAEGEHPVQSLYNFLGSPEGEAYREESARLTPLTVRANDWWDDATNEMKENLPQVRPRSMKYYAAGILEATINMGPAVAATILTKNPNIGAAILGGQVYGETYASLLDRGFTPQQANQAGLFFAAAEILTERLPLGVLTRNNMRGLKRILTAAGAESIQEPLTEILQMGYDVGVLNYGEDLTFTEVMLRLMDAGIIGFGAGAGMGGIAAAADRLSTPAGQELISEESELEKIADRMEERREIRTETQDVEEQLIPLQTAMEDPTQLSDEQTERLTEDDMVTVAVDGRVQVLPKLRRERNRRERQLEEMRGEEALIKEGANVEEAPVIYETIAARHRADEAGAETDLTPTPLQVQWGNYEKGRFTWNTQEIAIETPQGEWRRGPGWQQKMASGYGYFVGKPGADTVTGRPTEGVDAYIGPDVNFQVPYIINQENPDGSFDEHKVMVGYRGQGEAELAYRNDFAPAPETIDVAGASHRQLREWLEQPEHTKPVILAGTEARRTKVKSGEAVRINQGETAPHEGVADLETPEGMLYSFGETGYEAEAIARVPMSEVMEAAKARGYEDFDDAGTIEGARILNDMFEGTVPRSNHLRVLRVGTATGQLANRNAGDAQAVAAHLLRQQSMEGPAIVGELGDTLTLWEVREPALPEGYEAMPVFSVIDETVPTTERYELVGKRPNGAPHKVKTLSDVDQQIDDLAAIMADSNLIPEEAWIWYEDSGAEIREITRQDPGKMHQTVQLLAILSQATGVAANTSSMVKAAYEIAKGNTSPLVGIYPNKMSVTINTVLSGVELTTDLPNVGDKMMNFYRNLYDATFSTNKWPEATTIDRWIARALGYRSDAISSNQYTYAMKVMQDATTRYNARHGTDFLPSQGQAAIWVHERSRDSLEKKGTETPVDAFSDALATEAAHVTYEHIPSLSTEMGEKISGLPWQERADYSQAMAGVIYEREKNLLLEEFGIPLYNNQAGSGGYEGNIMPNHVTGVMLLKEGGQYDTPTADAIAQAYMYIYQQDSVLWYRPDRAGNAAKTRRFSQAVTFRLEGELSAETEQVFFDALRETLGPDAAYTRSGPKDLTIIDVKNENGIPDSQLKPEAFVAKMHALADRLGEELGIARTMQYGVDTGYQRHDWQEDPDGRALIEQIKTYAAGRGRPDLSKRVSNWRQSAEKTTRDWADRRPRERLAASVPVDRFERGPDLRREVYGRFGDVNDDVDTTESLKYYDLTPVVTQPELVNKLVEDLGFQVETFSFEPGKVRIPKLGTQNYEQGYLWIYDPAAEHGSFKDTEYTRAWRVSHEAGHGITESFMQKRYGDSRRYGRLGRPMMGQRGAEGKRVDVKLEPLTLTQAQRAVEWEDVTFRAQRMLLRELGIRVDDVTFAREYNTNIADAVYRSTTGDFGDPGEYGFVPSSVLPDVKSVLQSLEATEKALAEQQGRAPTEGVDLATWEPISDTKIRQAVKQKLGREPVVGEIMFNVGEEIPRNPTLSPAEKAIEQRLIDKMVENGIEGIEELYAALPESEGGVILSVDTMRELSDDYLADRTQSNATQRPASWAIRQIYERRLRRATPEGKLPRVLFSAGGTGSGKTTSLKKIVEISDYEIILDTNLSKLESATEKIDQATASGRNVGIMYVWRDPVEAFADGMLSRAERQRREFGTGRTVPLQVHMRTHINGYEVNRQLTGQYATDPRVEFTVLDNSLGKGNAAVLGSIEDLTPTNLDYNSLEGQLYGTLKEQLENGRISQATYDGVVTGTEAFAYAEEELGARAGRQPESQREEQRADQLESLRRIATEFVARFPNSPDITIAPTVDSLPEAIRDRVKNNSPKNITGMFVPAREGAKVYLVAENLTGPRHALDTMLHEVVGHYGLRSILGAEYDVTMDRIFKSHSAGVRAAARRNSITLNTPDNRRLAAEEFVAYRAQEALMSGTLPKGSWFTDLMDAIKIAIARLRGVQFSDTEVTRLIMKARKFTSTPAGLAHGAARNMRPPVLGYRAWQAINDRRVPKSGTSEIYVKELRFQRRAGNLDAGMTNEMIEWVVEQPGRVDKYELLKKLQQIGNQQAMFHVESDGRRDAILNGDNMDSAFDIEEGSKRSRFWNALVFKAQDKFIDLLNVQKAIEQQRGAPLPDDIDAYLQEELFHGKVKHQTDEFHNKVIKPLVAEIRDSEYTWDEVEWFLYARHAPEANAQLYKINRATAQARRELTKQVTEAEETYKDRPQAKRRSIAAAQAEFKAHIKERLKKDPSLKELSGMSNAEAEDVMAVLGEKADIAQLEKIAELVDAMTAESRRMKVEEGLETQETIDAWEKTYKYYVPLKGFQDGPGNTTFFPKKGRGYDTGGALQKRRMGRRSKAANILANIVASHQTTLVLAEKAKVGRSLLEMVKANPNPKLWSVDTLPTTRAIDKTTGLVVTRRDPLHRLRDNVVRVKVEGVDHIVTFNENYEPGVRIARSMKNLSSQEMNWIFSSLLKLNRILSAVNTSFNPEFILSNLVRDLQTAAINLNSTDAANVKTKIMKDVFKAHRGIRRYLDLPSLKDPESADFWRAEFDEYRALGGQVGWLDNYKDVQDLEQALYREMHKRDAGLISWQTLGRMGRYIEMENQAIENAVRLSAFHHAKQYMTPERAASLSKNLTVNFNRKGDVGTQMNALFLFYNASIQGMSIMWHVAKSPRARHVMYGVIAFGAAMSIINRMLGGEDDDGENRYDKIEFFEKERNLIIMLPERWQPEDPESIEDYYIKIPLPYGYNMLYMLGDKIGSGIDYAAIGNKRELDPMQGAFEIIATALGSFNPIGTGPTPLQTMLPTVFQPLAQVSENTAWHGGPVFPEPNTFDPAPPPESQWSYRSTPEHTKALAAFLNRLGGGTDVRPAEVSFLDISPETIQLWEEFLTGGAGRFATNLIEVGVMAKEGEVEVRNVPFVRRLVGKTDERQVQNRFYERREEILYAEAERDSAREGLLGTTGDDRDTARERLDAVEETYAVPLRMIAAMESANRYIRGQNISRRAMEERTGWTEERIEDAVEVIEERKVRRMQRLNSLYNDLLRDHLDSRESLFPLFQRRDREEVGQNFRSGDMPAFAALIESLPTRVPTSAREGIEEAAQ